jgi:TPR repeat protein
MTPMFKAFLSAAVLMLTFNEPVAAGQFEDAVAAYATRDYSTSYRLFRPLADRGDAKAQNYVGEHYFNGWGVTQNYELAAKWYLKAAVQGNAEAQFNFCGSLFRGQGVPQSDFFSHIWCNLSAAQGYEPAADRRAAAEQFLTRAQTAEAQHRALVWKPNQGR